MKHVGDSINNIAAITEEQAAATHDITNRMETVQEHTKNIKQHAKETGESIYQVSTEVNELRKETIKSLPELTPEQLIRVVQTEHALYQWWIYNALLGYQSIEDLDDVKHEECRFGKWYDKMKRSSLSALPAFKAIEKPHKEFHELVERVKQTIVRDDSANVNELLAKLNMKTNDIIALLRNLQEKITP